MNSHVSAFPRTLAVNARNGSSRSCFSCSSSVRKTPVAIGMTARDRMAASSSGRLLEAAFGLAFRRLSPSSVPAHWNSWEGAVPHRSLIHFGKRSNGARIHSILLLLHRCPLVVARVLGRGGRLVLGQCLQLGCFDEPARGSLKWRSPGPPSRLPSQNRSWELNTLL